MEDPNSWSDQVKCISEALKKYHQTMVESVGLEFSLPHFISDHLESKGFAIVKIKDLPESMVDRVLCCSKCNTPVSPTSNGGFECRPCGFFPSMQDTYFKLVLKK